MIIWGSGGGVSDLGVVEQRKCQSCERDRPFKLMLQYRYGHLYWIFRWVTQKTYLLTCEVCHRGWKLNKADVEPKLSKNPIPLMTRYGWAIPVGVIVLVIALAQVSKPS